MDKKIKYLLWFLIEFSSFGVWGQTAELVTDISCGESCTDILTRTRDGNHILTADCDGRVAILNAQNIKKKKSYRMRDNSANDLALSSDNRYVAIATFDRDVIVKKYATGRTIKTISEVYANTRNGAASMVVFSPDNRTIYFGGNTGVIYKTKIKRNEVPVPVYEPVVKSSIITASTTPDKSHFVFSAVNCMADSCCRIVFFNFRTGRVDKEFVVPSHIVQIEFLPGMKQALLMTRGGVVHFLDYKNDTIVATLATGENHSRNTAYSLGVSKNGKMLVTTDGSSNVRIWDIAAKKEILKIGARCRNISVAAFVGNDKELLTYCCSTGGASLYKLQGMDSIAKQLPVAPFGPVKDKVLPDYDLSKVQVQFDKDNVPVSAGERPIIKQEEYHSKDAELEIAIWDRVQEDGDIISLNLNGNWVLENYKLTKKKKIINITLVSDTNNYLTLYAHNEGDVPPNTAIISILNGREQKMMVLKSDLIYCGAINFVYP